MSVREGGGGGVCISLIGEKPLVFEIWSILCSKFLMSWRLRDFCKPDSETLTSDTGTSFGCLGGRQMPHPPKKVFAPPKDSLGGGGQNKLSFGDIIYEKLNLFCLRQGFFLGVQIELSFP